MEKKPNIYDRWRFLENALKELEAHHDRNWNNSDDMRYWRIGSAECKVINALRAAVGMKGPE